MYLYVTLRAIFVYIFVCKTAIDKKCLLWRYCNHSTTYMHIYTQHVNLLSVFLQYHMINEDKQKIHSLQIY